MILALLLSLSAHADPQLDRGLLALRSMTGCYSVDYSFTETEGLKPGYERDKRVYDVTRNKTIKEWIYADEITPTRVRLQHVLFGTRPDGSLIDGSLLKHTGDDWEYSPGFLYQFDAPRHWSVQPLQAGQWLRRTTNLDDGLRYQCASAWRLDTAYPEWSCSTYAPIPGREYRDMQRKDYQALDRSSRLVVQPGGWLEREVNVKVIQEGATRTPLANEQGKIFYVKLPDQECEPARAFLAPRVSFWRVTREAWDSVLVGDAPFAELAGMGRYSDLQDLEDKYMPLDLGDRGTRDQALTEIRALIEQYRAH